MGIFKDQKYLDPKKIKIPNYMKRIAMLLNKSLLILGILFNAFMSLMMLGRLSGFSILFLINLYFLARHLKGKKVD